MKKIKSLLTILLTIALLPIQSFGTQIQVQADTSALAPSYNTDINYIAYTTEVEDQSQSNYCWAYMADSVLEAYLLKVANVPYIDLSESDMINQLNSGGYGFYDLYTGGNYHQALAYWTRGSLYGPRLESDLSLTDYYVSETAELGKYDRANDLSKQNYIQSIKNLLVKYGAVGVSVYFTAETRAAMTRDGAYYYPQEISPGVNHGVTIVGWNDDFAPQWFFNGMTVPQQPQNKGAFLVKNSWGKYDASSIGGNTGYYWISYDNYFQDAFAVTQVIERSKLYDYVYERDYRGLYDYAAGSVYSQTYSLGWNTQWVTGFATYVKAGASYRFYLNNQELTQLSGTMAQTGYHTFQLTNPVQVNGSLELRVEVNGNQEAIPIACSANSHEPDMNNVCLKVFTKTGYQGGSTPLYPSQNPYAGVSTVTGVTLTPQDCAVRQGGTQGFTARVFGYGTVQPSQRINWQISGSSSANTRITDNGVLYVGADETSDVLYIYANSYVDTTQGASARVEIVKNGTTNTGTNQTGGNGTGTNQTGSNQTGSNQTGTNHAGTNINGSPIISNNTNTGSTPSDYPSADVSDIEVDEEDTVIRVGTVDNGIYTFWEDGTAQYMKCTTRSRVSISIPANVKMGGETYAVTTIENNGIENNKKVRNVTIGKNITQIGDEAFRDCKQLKKVKIKSEQIEYIGEDAFQGIAENAVIYVPRSCLAEYRAMVRESGNAKARVKAYN